MGERETERDRWREGWREGERVRESKGRFDRECKREEEGGWEGDRERQHLTMMTIVHEHFNCMQTVSCIRERERGARSVCETLKMVKWYQHFLHISRYEIPYFSCMKRERERERERERDRWQEGGREGGREERETTPHNDDN